MRKADLNAVRRTCRAASWVPLALALLLASADARGAVRFLAYAGGSATTHEKSDLNENLDPYTIRDDTGSWEFGGGVRLFTRTGPDGRPLSGDPRWEVRGILGLGGGDFPGTTVQGRRSVYPYQYSYEFVSKESYSYTYWTLAGLFLVNVRHDVGVFIGPAVQSVTTKAKRKWTGPSECSECGDARDESTERYGSLELGPRWKPAFLPVSLEAYWIPTRIELSTTHILQSDNWTTANFPSLTRTFGARVVYEF